MLYISRKERRNGIFDVVAPEDTFQGKLTVFQTETSITLSFADRIYVIEQEEPFYNIALKCLEIDDMIPFYVEIARREGKGHAFRDQLLREIERLQLERDED